MALGNDSCNLKAASGHGHPRAQATASFSTDSTRCDKMKYKGSGDFFICPSITLWSTEGFFWNLRQSLEISSFSSTMLSPRILLAFSNRAAFSEDPLVPFGKSSWGWIKYDFPLAISYHKISTWAPLPPRRPRALQRCYPLSTWPLIIHGHCALECRWWFKVNDPWKSHFNIKAWLGWINLCHALLATDAMPKFHLFSESGGQGLCYVINQQWWV